jgi:hypothetical protein
MIHLFRLAGIGALATVLIACQAASKIVGTWESEIAAGQGKLTQTMKADNTYSGVLELPLPSGGKAKVAFSGNYKLEGENLTTTVTKYSMEGVPKSFEEMAKAEQDKAMNKPQSSTISWKNDNEMVMTVQGQQMTFKRKT